MSRPVTHHCLLCQSPLNHQLTLLQVLQFRPLEFPTVCLKCQPYLNPFDSSQEVCKGCWGPIIAGGNNQMSHCHNCQHWREKYGSTYLNHTVLFNYSPVIHDWLHHYKYIGDIRLAHVVKTRLQAYAKKYSRASWLVLPSSAQSLKARGFHPTGLLLETANIPFQQIFQYVGDGRRQAQKSRHDRMQLAQPFQIKKDCQLDVNNPIILFDDVYTTGATMMAAKDCLYTEYGEEIQLESVSLIGSVIRDLDQK